MCEHYSSSQPITASVSIINSSQFRTVFQHLSSFPNETNSYFFLSFPHPPLLSFFWSEVGNLQRKKRNPAPDLQSLKRHGSLLWSFVTEGLGAAKDTISLLGLLQDSKFLRFTVCFILSGRIYLRRASSSIKETKETLFIGEHTRCIHWYTGSIQKHGALRDGWEHSTSKSTLVPHAELYKNW